MKSIGDKVIVDNTVCTIQEVYSSGKSTAYKLYSDDGTDYGIVAEEDVEDYEPATSYTFTVTVRDRENLVEVFMVNADGKVIERAHGHIKENSAIGVVQALDYATMRLHRNMEQF
jgi:hypothetical protein